jgi:hypothetical protein
MDWSKGKLRGNWWSWFAGWWFHGAEFTSWGPHLKNLVGVYITTTILTTTILDKNGDILRFDMT